MDRALVSGTRCGGSTPLGSNKHKMKESNNQNLLFSNTKNENDNEIVKIFCDGASRGNPGPSAIGVIIYLTKPETKTIKISKRIENGTNNNAEYTALIEALKKCKELNLKKIEINLDSEVIVRQVTGIYKVKDNNLKKLFSQVKDLLNFFEYYKINHIYREKNKTADYLANLALDNKL